MISTSKLAFAACIIFLASTGTQAQGVVNDAQISNLVIDQNHGEKVFIKTNGTREGTCQDHNGLRALHTLRPCSIRR